MSRTSSSRRKTSADAPPSTTSCSCYKAFSVAADPPHSPLPPKDPHAFASAPVRQHTSRGVARMSASSLRQYLRTDLSDQLRPCPSRRSMPSDDCVLAYVP